MILLRTAVWEEKRRHIGKFDEKKNLFNMKEFRDSARKPENVATHFFSLLTLLIPQKN